ncbi:hypothetical protein C3497_08885 [Zoogloeaceae bacteirum Par-f-2]|uniref:hypothetical protein n=1 Tax=Pseudothauera hydrothermalis TaxID=2184083 RepID=UPI000D2563F9|nr:hypothetical protein [Pseudothauera hydrothermalis]AVZ79543.1 hypothetical protein C3497_08885 [Zoogloeaceae bacteirum Par-f-2]
MRKTLTLLLLLSAPLATPVLAAPLSCPDLSAAVQVATCPSDAELKYTYNGYCSDNARLYDNDGEVCTSFEAYLKRKNNALWESADGAFSGYLTCNQPAATLRSATPVSMTVHRKGKLTMVECEYSDGSRLTHRTKVECKVEQADCTAAGGCTATCAD